ncbi:MAG: polysaccharide biosynthesis/export family protein [Kofleriaceae bacterium]
MRAFGLFLLLLVLGCPSSLPAYDYAKEPDPRNKELVLGVGDIVAVNVWENKDLNTETTIRPDGTITIPLVGDLKAAGETPSALKEQIKKRLTDFVKLQGTEITVAVKDWKSYRFTIQGEVVRQGVFTSSSFVTVSDAIAIAGGPTRFAKQRKVLLFRPVKGAAAPKSIPIDYEALSSGKRLDMNIFVLPGDTIYVP